MPVRERRGKTAIRPVQAIAGLSDGDPSITGMFVFTAVLGQIMARPGVRSAHRSSCVPVDIQLRHGLAATLTKAVEPGYRRFAAKPVEDEVGQDIRHRA